MKCLLIDNYDSFTWNLYHFLGDIGVDTEVVRNDKISVDEVLSRDVDGVVISPGPKDPTDAGIIVDLVKRASGLPILGVCLGHQAIAMAYGGIVTRADHPVHGKVSTITHRAGRLFADIPHEFRATRYHSLLVSPEGLPASLQVTASCDNVIMAIEHEAYPHYGIQFHPESIETECGHQLLRNFFSLVAAPVSLSNEAQIK